LVAQVGFKILCLPAQNTLAYHKLLCKKVL
jgi:hypothetical protein